MKKNKTRVSKYFYNRFHIWFWKLEYAIASILLTSAMLATFLLVFFAFN